MPGTRAQPWTTRQVQFQLWCALPENEREPKTQEDWAVAHGVRREWCSRQKNLPGWRDAVYSIARQSLDDDLAQGLSTFGRRVRQGDRDDVVAAAKLAGRYSERQEITGKDGMPLNDFSYVADKLASRLDALAQQREEASTPSEPESD